MKINFGQLKKIIREETTRLLSEDRDALKDILDHETAEDAAHVAHNAWEGGELHDDEQENLIMPVDHTDVVTGEETISILDDEPMGVVEESYGEANTPLDLNGDTFLTPEELYAHFDLDGDGVVSIEDYVAHIRWHCENPDAFAKEGIGDDVSNDVMYFILDNLGLVNEADLDEIAPLPSP